MADGLGAHDTRVSDERLTLLFVCAHPAIDARVHTPLILQVVLGLEAADIAAALVTPASTLGQRLTRAKHKILRGGHVSWDEIVVLYDGLIGIAPTLGARLGKIAAVAEANGPAAALELLENLAAEDVQQHQSYWAVRAHLLQLLGAEAEAALAKTLELTEDPAVRAFLRRRRQRQA